MSRVNRATSPVCVDGHVRVSRVGRRRGPSFISPTVQREAIEDWAARHDFELLKVYEELDESGMRRDRPLLELAIQRIEEGASAGLAVWRVDRFGRSLNDGVQIIERVRAVGGRFFSVHDGLDVDTEAGRLALRILLSVAEFNLEGWRASWDATRENAIRRGVHIAHTSPPGYRKTRAGRLRPHPRDAVITEMFERRAAGASLVTLCRFLEDNGVRTGGGNRIWNTAGLSYLLRARVYLGEVYHGPYTNPSAHAPLVDAATWQAARHPAWSKRTPTSVPAILNGLTRCAACRYTMRAYVAKPPHSVPALNYRCRKFHTSGVCPAPATIVVSKLEPYVTDVMLRVLGSRRGTPVQRLAAAEENARDAERALNRYRDNDQIVVIIGEKAFLNGLAIRQGRLRDARLEVMDARARLALHGLPPVGDVRRQWPTMTVSEKREVARGALDAVFVARGALPAAQRVTVCPAGTGPRLVSRQGHRTRPMPPIQPRRGWINPERLTT